MSESRTKKTSKNAYIGIICQVATLIINFASRTLFINLLGADYLGINGLFTNILGYLSLAELGFGSAIVYNLYKYLAEDNKEKIAANINFYGKIYKIIALFIFILGIALIPFLQYIVKFPTDTGINYKLYYFMFLMQSVMSYLFVYKSCIFSADQKQYLISGYSTFFSILTKILQLIFLWITHLYFVYLLISIIIQLINNIYIYYLAEKYYPFLKNKKANLSKEEKKEILINVKSLFYTKIGIAVGSQTDNILISIFVNTTTVGYYSNYVMLYGIIKSFSDMLFAGIGASIGNFLATNSKDKSYECFYMINFAQFWVFTFAFLSMFCLIDDFIRLWIGEKYVLGYLFCGIITLDTFVEKISSSVWAFNYAAGMFEKTKYITLGTSVLNLGFSLLFCTLWGINGIIGATLLARVIWSIWFHPYILFKYYFNKSLIEYFKRQGIYYFIFLFLMLFIYLIKRNIIINNWFLLIFELVVIIFSLNIIIYMLFNKTKEFADLKVRINQLIKRK